MHYKYVCLYSHLVICLLSLHYISSFSYAEEVVDSTPQEPDPPMEPPPEAPVDPPMEPPPEAPVDPPTEPPPEEPSQPPAPQPQAVPPLQPPPASGIVTKVTGIVYCFKCYNWNTPNKSTLASPLSGAKVRVTCRAGGKIFNAEGSTNSIGKYKITIKGYDYKRYGKEPCLAKLINPPKKSVCNKVTGYHEGLKGAPLQVLKKTTSEVLLTANSFACAPKNALPECPK